MLYVILIIGMITAYINGMHDGGNIAATTVTSRIMTPRKAVIMCGIANFIGALVLNKAVAATIAGRLGNTAAVADAGVHFAGLFAISVFLGSMVWNITTWILKMPSSSSHSLLGSLAGCLIAVWGIHGVYWDQFMIRVVAAMFISPVAGFLLGYLTFRAEQYLLRRATMVWNQRVRKIELVATFLLALCYGSNDTQKVAGILAIVVYAGGYGDMPLWLFALTAGALALGTMTGGHNIMGTVGKRIVKIHSDGALASQLAGFMVVEFSNLTGLPISSTQVVTGTVMGVGAEDRPRSVNWKITGKIAAAWLLTLPSAGLAGWCICQLMMHIL